MNKDIAIDWDWVRKELVRIEKIPSAGERGALRSGVETCLKKAVSLCAPRAASVKKSIKAVGPEFVELEGGIKLSSEFLSSYLSGAKYLLIFLVTIGPRLEDEASRLMGEGDSLAGYLLDRIGSLAVESAAEAFENGLRKSYKSESLSVSRRLSPGYCDWPIEEQFKLKRLIDFSRAGVRLTQSCMMVPKKSISAVVGIGAVNLFSEIKSQCVICSKTECDYRRNR